MVRTFKFDYQLDRHCSKTPQVLLTTFILFDYQLDRHCSKTVGKNRDGALQFDYQLDRHCSKTSESWRTLSPGLITS